jgi:hypothetical protein
LRSVLQELVDALDIEIDIEEMNIEEMNNEILIRIGEQNSDN